MRYPLLSIVLICVTSIVLICVTSMFSSCETSETSPKNIDVEVIENTPVDVFSMSESERRNRINDIYRQSRELSQRGYKADGAGGYRLKALLFQVEFSILTYSAK